MSRRAEHLAEMRLALAEGLSIDEAKRRLAQLRHRAAMQTLEDQGFPINRRGFVSQPERREPFWWQRD